MVLDQAYKEQLTLTKKKNIKKKKKRDYTYVSNIPEKNLKKLGYGDVKLKISLNIETLVYNRYII